MKPIDLNNRKVRDPERFPNVIIPLENSVKKFMVNQNNKMFADLTKEMVKVVKNK